MILRRNTARYLSVLFMVLMPAVLAYGTLNWLNPQALRTTTAHAETSNPTNPLLPSPTGVQITPLDSTLHVTWTPATDPAIAWQMVAVWDGPLLQQSKVVGKTARAAQANGLMPGHAYTVKVYSMDAQGGLSVPAQMDAATDEQHPMRNAAFFENFNEAPGDLSSDYFDVRTSQGKGQRPEDVGQASKFLVFGSENHFHTEMIGGVERGELYIRPRVPMDLSDGGVRTFQTEFDVSATQHSAGKWPEIHFVDAAHVPWSSEEFGAGNGDDWPNSITFSVRGGNGGSTSNLPLIETNIAGVQNRYLGTRAFFTPVNIRVPIVVRMSRTMAALYINGDLAVRADFNAPLPYTSGYWMLAHRSWYSDRDHATSPVINQVVHWDTIQFDGPTGSYNPVVKTYIQSTCPGVVRNEHGRIEGCPRLIPLRGTNLNVPVSISEDASTARSAVLRFSGYSDNGSLSLRVNNGQPITLTVATGGYQNVLNSYDIPVSSLRTGLNTLAFTTASANDVAISEVQLEVVFNQQRVMNREMVMGPMPMLQATANNFRIDHLLADPDVYTATTNLYNIGGTALVPYTVELLNPKPYLTLSQTAGALVSPSFGGGVTPLNMRFNFAGVSTDDEGDVIVVRVNGGVMPVYIGILVVASGATAAPTYVTTFPATTAFNKDAIPDYHGSGDSTPTPTSTALPAATQTSTPTMTTVVIPTDTPGATSTATPTSNSTSTPIPTDTPIFTITPAATATWTGTAIAISTLAPTFTGTPVPTGTPDGGLPAIPPGVPSHFSYGLFNANTSNLPAGVPLDFRYQYLSGGVNTGDGWADWNPNGGYATSYINAARLGGMTPAFVYYQILQSAPSYDEYSNFQIASTMHSYFDDFKLLMQKCGQAGGNITVDIEPDLTGVMQQHSSNTNDDASLQHVIVGSSGQGDVTSYSDNFRGFYQALVHLRDLYAPNVSLGIDVSPWGASDDLVIALRNNPNYDWQHHANRTATYLNSLGSGFQMLYFNPSDRDAAYYQVVQGSNRWWDPNNVRQPTFNTMAAWLGQIVQQTQRRVMLWQVPNGNQVYRSENNTDGHWQDNRAEYFLNPTSGRSHMEQWANYGVLGIMFGAGAGSQSHYFDYKGDGVTNPPAINGNEQVAVFPDDDGGYLRLRLGDYFLGGTIPLPTR